MKKCLLLLLAAALMLTVGQSCEKEELDTTPRVVCAVGSAGTAMLGEVITVNVVNISAATSVTVKFGREKTITRTGPGTVSYAFTTAGLKSIRVTTSPAEVEKTVYLVEVQALESLQSLAARLKKDPDLCLVMCHRANSSDWSIPENSLSAIQKCINDKVDIVENDVYTTKDGVLVVSHDSNIKRETTYGYDTPIKNLTLADIKSYYLLDRNGNPTTEKMLTLDEYLEACKGQIYINIDIGPRDASVTAVVKAIAAKGMLQQCLIYCNSVEKIQEAFKANPDANAYGWVSSASALVENGLQGNTYFTQCSWFPTTAEASASGVPNSTSPTKAATVAEASSAGTIITVNAIYTSDNDSPKTLYPKNFTEAQIKNLFDTFPACQCVHVDTGAEARAALQAYGKHVTER